MLGAVADAGVQMCDVESAPEPPMSTAAISLLDALKACVTEAVGVLESNLSIGRTAGNVKPGLALPAVSRSMALPGSCGFREGSGCGVV